MKVGVHRLLWTIAAAVPSLLTSGARHAQNCAVAVNGILSFGVLYHPRACRQRDNPHGQLLTDQSGTEPHPELHGEANERPREFRQPAHEPPDASGGDSRLQPLPRCGAQRRLGRRHVRDDLLHWPVHLQSAVVRKQSTGAVHRIRAHPANQNPRRHLSDRCAGHVIVEY